MEPGLRGRIRDAAAASRCCHPQLSRAQQPHLVVEQPQQPHRVPCQRHDGSRWRDHLHPLRSSRRQLRARPGLDGQRPHSSFDHARPGREWPAAGVLVKTSIKESSMRDNLLPCLRQRTAGFSLLEVLISLVIMSVGLLGIAGLMTGTLKSDYSAAMRTQATAMAYNIIDRMRTNVSGATNGSYATTMPAAPSAATSVPATCTGSGAGCTSTTLATYDVNQWEYELAHALPQGRGSIATAATATAVTVTVLWNDSRAKQALGGAPAASTFSLTVN